MNSTTDELRAVVSSGLFGGGASGDSLSASSDDIVLELKLPVPVKELAAVTDALCKIHGKNTLFMRQVGQMLQLYKSRAASPPNASDQAQPPDQNQPSNT